MATLSREDQALIQYMADSGVPHKVTSTTGGKHAEHSYHYAQGTGGPGLAVDFASLQGGNDTHLAIYQALLPLPLGPHLAELFYSGPGGGFWKNGRAITPDSNLASTHHNHVHVAVPLGMFVQWPKPQGGPVPDATPDYQVNTPPVSIAMTADGKGYVILTQDGGVFAFGTATYLGRVHTA